MSDVGDKSDFFELTILLMDGSQVSVQVKANSTVEDVKFSLISKTSQVLRWTPERMRLLYGQVQLQDDDTVEECGLRSESVVVQDDTTPSGSGTIEYTIAGEFPQGTSADWTPAVELDANTSELQSPPEHATRFNELSQHRLKSCDICGFKDEENKWRVIEPDVSDGDMHFRISLPGEGFYECSITGLRWEIKGAITITYRYCSWSEYAPIILIKKTEFCGPLFNILAEDDIIKAIHLPHFICLKDADRNIENTFAIFYVRERSYRVNKPSAVHQTHIELQMPTFSLLGVIIDRNSWFPCHSLTMIYQTKYNEAAILHIYVIPCDFSIIQAVHRQESESILIKYPAEIKTFYIGRKYSLMSSSEIQITPPEMKFSRTDMDSKQPFYEVIVRGEPSSFKLKLTKRKKTDPLWQTSLQYQNGKVSFWEDSDEDVSQRESSLPVKEQSLPSTSGVRLSVSDSNADILSSDEGIRKSYSDAEVRPDTEMQNMSASPLSPVASVSLEGIDSDLKTEPISQLSPDRRDNLGSTDEHFNIEPASQLSPEMEHSETNVNVAAKPSDSSSEMEHSETNVNVAGKPSDSSSDGEKAELALFGPSHIVADAGLDFYGTSEYPAALDTAKFNLIGSCHHLQVLDLDFDKYPITLSPVKVETPEKTPVETPCHYIIDSEDTCGRTLQVGSYHCQKDPATICSDITEESFHRDYDIFPDALQEEFLSIQKVIQAMGKESAILCDKGTQTEKCSHSGKGKQRRVFCNFSTQTEVTFSDENLQAHKKLHSSFATQTDSNFQHCPSIESHGEVDVLPENKTKEESLKLQPIDSDVEMLRRDKPKLIDASIQTVDTRPPNDDSDKGSIQLSNVTVQTLESGEKKTLQSDASLQTEKVQRVQLDSDERIVQEPIEVEHETRLPRDIENLTSNKCDLSDLIYFEKEQCPCRMPKVKKDKLKWTIITPNIRENGNKKFSIFLPGKGYYECAVTKLRWITKSQVTLTYEYCSWDEYISDVQKQCWIIGSSLFNITTQDGNVEAVYLPHFICETVFLGSREAMYSAVYNIACFRNNIFLLEIPSEVTLSHAILRNQPLTIMGVILCQVCQVPVHAIILIYQTLQADSSNFHVYLLPNDSALIQAVDLHENHIKSMKIQRPQIITLTYGKKYKLTSFANVTITPSDIKFCYFRYNLKQPFYEVNCTDMNYNIKLSLTEKNKIAVLWELLIKPDMFKKLRKGVDFVQRHKKEIIYCLKMTQPIWSQLRLKNVININEEREVGSHITEIQQNRALVQLIMKRGEEAEEELYNILLENNPCFVNEVECNYSDKLCNNCLKQWSLACLQDDSLTVKEINNKILSTWLAHLVSIFSGMIVGYLIGHNFS